MTEEQVAQKILRFYAEQNIRRECELKGEEFNAEKFEQAFQTMLATETGDSIVAKLTKSVKESA